MANLPRIAVVTFSKLPSTGMHSNYLLFTCISERHSTCRIAKINTSQMQAPLKTLNLVLAINKHLKVIYVWAVPPSTNYASFFCPLFFSQKCSLLSYLIVLYIILICWSIGSQWLGLLTKGKHLSEMTLLSIALWIC